MFDDAYNSDREQQLESLLKTNQYEPAIELLQRWYDQEPWNGEVLMRMAVVHWLAGEPARTLRDLDALLTIEPDNAEVLARRAQALLMLGKREDAEVSLDRAEALDPKAPGVLLNRALLHEEHGDYAQAVTSLSAYLEMLPQDHLALARRAHLKRQLGEYAQSLDDAVACVHMHPEDPEGHFAEALALVTLERGDEALAACECCLKLQAGFLPALRLKVDLLADLQRVNEAEAALVQLSAVDPNGPQTRLLGARLASEHNDFSTALTEIQSFLDDSPDEAYGYYRRGMIYFRMEDYAHALSDFQEYARLAPNALEAYEQQFLCYLSLERMTEAVTIAEHAVRLQPDNYRVQYNLAFVQLVSGQLETALRGFQTTLQLDPSNEELLLRIHMALSEHASLAVRLDWFRNMVGQFGKYSPMVAGLFAEAALEKGDLEEALRISRDEVLAIDDRRTFGYLIGIKALCLLDRYPEALELADRGVAALPQEGRLRIARALILRDLQRSEEALRELDIAGILLPNDPEVVRQQALVNGSAGRIDEALQLLQQAVQLDAGSSDTYFWLGYFLLHRKRYHDALEAADRMLAQEPVAAEGHLIRGAALRGLKRRREADAEIARVQEQDPNLLARLSADPVIAALVSKPPSNSLAKRIGRSAALFWQFLCQAAGH